MKLPGIYFWSFMSPSVSLLNHGSLTLLRFPSLCSSLHRGEEREQSDWELNCGPPVSAQGPACPMSLSEFLFFTVIPSLSTLQAFQFSLRYVLLLPSLRILLNCYFSASPPPPQCHLLLAFIRFSNVFKFENNIPRVTKKYITVKRVH
jgi:hypothetical protein